MKKQLLFAAILSIIISAGVFAQKKGLTDKLKKIEGKTESIVIKTDKGITTFSGEEAAALMKMLKPEKTTKKIIVVDGDDDFSWNENDDVDVDEQYLPIKKIRVIDHGVRDKEIEINVSDILDSSVSKNVEKTVMVENKTGNKVVTVTTKENGTEKIEMFEGADADKYLKEHKSDKVKAEPSSTGLKKKVKKIVIKDENEK